MADPRNCPQAVATMSVQPPASRTVRTDTAVDRLRGSRPSSDGRPADGRDRPPDRPPPPARRNPGPPANGRPTAIRRMIHHRQMAAPRPRDPVFPARPAPSPRRLSEDPFSVAWGGAWFPVPEPLFLIAVAKEKNFLKNIRRDRPRLAGRSLGGSLFGYHGGFASGSGEPAAWRSAAARRSLRRVVASVFRPRSVVPSGHRPALQSIPRAIRFGVA